MLRAGTAILAAAWTVCANSPEPSPVKTHHLGHVCDAAESVCATFQMFGSDRVTVTLESMQNGWISLGFGSSMANASSFVVVWNETVSQRSATGGHSMPRVAPVQDAMAQETPSQFTPSPNTVLVASFSLPKSYFNDNGATQLIYATSSRQPLDPAKIAYHNGPHGSFSFDISSGATDVAGTPLAFLVHGFLMLMAWGILPYVFTFVARYLKHRLGHWWFRIHLLGALATFSFSIIGVLTVAIGGGVGFKIRGNTHVLLGATVVYVLLPLQMLLGYLSNRWFKEDRVFIPIWDRVHWWSGRVSIAVSIAAIHYGIYQAGFTYGWVAAFWAWIFIVLVAFLVGQVALGPSHHSQSSVNEQTPLLS
ncbi:hypothetical protein BC830DRAFT_1114500 [Chytriomyces sp. MP71]|nr:hypothetical protein BC830DRAFT_1114500 [Chytriomyces sp. MP71]